MSDRALEPAAMLALLDVVEAARGALEYARPVDLQAAVVQGGFPALDDALARFDLESGV